jgi:adenine deaminase
MKLRIVQRIFDGKTTESQPNHTELQQMKISGKIVDVINKRIFPGTIEISEGKIVGVTEEEVPEQSYIIPGLIDAHVHVESSMLIPSEFARISATHGTVASVSDPHEIANVLGMKGVEFMIANGKQVPFKFYFGASPCVPATGFESSGATIGVKELGELLQRDEILYMAEMMNYPGVLYKDREVMAKLALAKKYNKPVDGHAPGLKGPEAEAYAGAGITTDHECFTMEEALDKIKNGMNILIREGSAAKNLEELAPLVEKFPDRVMFCSDDRHPNDLVAGHMDAIIRKTIGLGYDPLTVIRCCTFNPVSHYGLGAGLLRKGDDADLAIIDNLHDFNVLSTYIKGNKVADHGKPLMEVVPAKPVNHFEARKIAPNDLRISPASDHIRVIQAIDGQLVTKMVEEEVMVSNGNIISDTVNDVLKLVVINRYNPSEPSIGFIKGFGLKAGAIASTVAHDSHNIIAVGVEDTEIMKAVNLLVESKGGIAAVNKEEEKLLPLPFGGIMSGDSGYQVATSYEALDKMAKNLGSMLHAPFMTLSFMALLVIPELKLSDKGLFDGNRFEFTSLFCDS